MQTFVLAQQPSGYFVLNDIMRYIDEGLEEEEDAVQETQEAPATTKPEPDVSIEGRVEPEHTPAVKADESGKQAEPTPLDAAAVDEKLEEASSSPETAPATTEKPTEAAAEAEPPVVKSKEDAKPEPVGAEKAIKEVEKEAAKQDKPQEPSPTSAAPRAAAAEKPAPAEPEKPKEQPKPMTWASRIAAAAAPVAKAVVPSVPKVATPPAQPRQAAPAAAQKVASPAAPAAQASEAAAPAAKDQNDEWQSVGHDSKRQNRPVSVSGPQETGREGAMAYIKYVTEKVQTEELRAELAQYGELAYFDVNRQKVSDLSSCNLTAYVTVMLRPHRTAHSSSLRPQPDTTQQYKPTRTWSTARALSWSSGAPRPMLTEAATTAATAEEPPTADVEDTTASARTAKEPLAQAASRARLGAEAVPLGAVRVPVRRPPLRKRRPR